MKDKNGKQRQVFARPLNVSKPRTDAEIKEAFNQGHIAEINDFEYDKLPKEVLEKIQKANKYFDENPPRAHSQDELDSFFKKF